MSMPASSEYTLGGKDVDLTNMVGVIKTPSGGTEPCLLKKMSDGKLGKYLLSSQFCSVYLLLALMAQWRSGKALDLR